MLQEFLHRFSALLQGEQAALYGAALLIAALPLPVFLAAFALACRFPRLRGRLGGSLFVSDLCVCLSAALFFLGREGRAAFWDVLCLLLFCKALDLVLYGALALPRALAAARQRLRKKRGAALAAKQEEEEAEPSPLPAPPSPYPPKVRCFEGGVQVERDVRLGHISQALRRLQGAPLTAGDRLEAQAAQQLLSVYEGKGVLRSEEAESLNDVMASLLKMMARYDL